MSLLSTFLAISNNTTNLAQDVKSSSLQEKDRRVCAQHKVASLGHFIHFSASNWFWGCFEHAFSSLCNSCLRIKCVCKMDWSNNFPSFMISGFLAYLIFLSTSIQHTLEVTLFSVQSLVHNMCCCHGAIPGGLVSTSGEVFQLTYGASCYTMCCLLEFTSHLYDWFKKRRKHWILSFS